MSTTEDVGDAVAPYVGENDTVKVIVPVVGQGFMDWLSNDEKAFAHADAAANELAEAVPGETVEARAAESDVTLAIHDALATFPADAIVVAIAGNADLVEALDEDGEPGRSIDGIPVHVVRSR